MYDWMQRGALREEAQEGDGGGGEAAKESDGAAELTALKAQVDAMKAELAEKDSGMRYWHEQAQKAASKAPEKAAHAKSEDDEEVDPIEFLAKEGSKGLDKLLAKRGFIRAEDVERRIESKAQTIAAENQLASEYPELKDTASDFFKATASHYKPLVDAGVPQHLAMKFAAEKAELEGYKTGKRLPKAVKEEREARAKAQAGDKGSKQAAETEESTDLDAFQKYICEQLEVTPDQYQKRAKAGVVVTGVK